MKLSECREKGFVRDSTDKEYATSVLEMSKLRIETVTSAVKNEKNISIYAATAYDALRELIGSIALRKEFKILNHLCLVAFIDEILNDEESAREFDRYRKIRNNIDYYGRKIDYISGAEIIKKIVKLYEKIRDKHCFE